MSSLAASARHVGGSSDCERRRREVTRPAAAPVGARTSIPPARCDGRQPARPSTGDRCHAETNEARPQATTRHRAAPRSERARGRGRGGSRSRRRSRRGVRPPPRRTTRTRGPWLPTTSRSVRLAASSNRPPAHRRGPGHRNDRAQGQVRAGRRARRRTCRRALLRGSLSGWVRAPKARPRSRREPGRGQASPSARCQPAMASARRRRTPGGSVTPCSRGLSRQERRHGQLDTTGRRRATGSGTGRAGPLPREAGEGSGRAAWTSAGSVARPCRLGCRSTRRCACPPRPPRSGAAYRR